MKHSEEVIELMKGYDHNVKYISTWSQGERARSRNRDILKRLKELGYKSIPEL